jgi:hypothetical protein
VATQKARAGLFRSVTLPSSGSGWWHSAGAADCRTRLPETSGRSPDSIAQTDAKARFDPEPKLTDLLLAFCVPMRLPQAHPRPTAIPIDEFDA